MLDLHQKMKKLTDELISGSDVMSYAEKELWDPKHPLRALNYPAGGEEMWQTSGGSANDKGLFSLRI